MAPEVLKGQPYAESADVFRYNDSPYRRNVPAEMLRIVLQCSMLYCVALCCIVLHAAVLWCSAQLS
jgi:hypothetical protein